MKLLVCGGVCASVMFGGVIAASAQSVASGVKVGFTNATIAVTGLPGFEPETGTGVFGGAWIEARRGRVGIRPEVLLTTRRFSATFTGASLDLWTRAIDVPVVLTVRTGSSRRVQPVFFGGPYFAFVSRATQTVASVTADISDELKDADIGATAGLGVEVKTPRGAVVIETRFAFGFRDLSEPTTTTFKSRTWLTAFGYRF